jgi:hypothetical protein
VTFEAHLPKVWRLAVHRIAEKITPDEVGVKLFVPPRKVGRQRPTLAIAPRLRHPLIDEISWTQRHWRDPANAIPVDHEMTDGLATVHTHINAPLRELDEGIHRPVEVHRRVRNASDNVSLSAQVTIASLVNQEFRPC